jgi:hypothetical protein
LSRRKCFHDGARAHEHRPGAKRGSLRWTPRVAWAISVGVFGALNRETAVAVTKRYDGRWVPSRGWSAGNRPRLAMTTRRFCHVAPHKSRSRLRNSRRHLHFRHPASGVNSPAERAGRPFS